MGGQFAPDLGGQYHRIFQSGLFSKEDAKCLMLTAIEFVDDSLVGYTNWSFHLIDILDIMYKEVEML